MSRQERPSFRARSSPDFLRYWFGGFLSNTGTSIQNVSAGVLILSLTNSPAWIGYLSAATFAPLFVFGMWGGVLSDRFSRRRIVQGASALSMAISVSLAVLVQVDRVTPAVLLVAAVGLGCSYALVKPTWSALLPVIVGRRDLRSATAISVLQYNLGNVVGAFSSSVVLLLYGPALAFLINAITFIGPIWAVRTIATPLDESATGPGSGSGGDSSFGPDSSSGPDSGSGGDLRDGIRYIVGSREMRVLLGLLVLLDVAGEASRTLAAPMSAVLVEGGENLAGLLIAGSSVSMAVVLFLHGRIVAPLPVDVARRWGFGLQGLGLLGLALAPSFVAAQIMAIPIGVGMAMVLPGLSAGLQSLSSPRYLGRVSSAFAVVHIGLRPVGGLCAGFLGAAFGPRVALAVIAVFPLSGIVAVWRTCRQSAPDIE